METDRFKVLEKLPPRQLALLSELWENLDTRKALQNLLALKQEEIAHFLALTAPDFDFVLKGRGGIEMAEWTMKAIRQTNKMENAKRAKLNEEAANNA